MPGALRQTRAMSIRVGVMSSAHMHAWGYAGGLKKNPEAILAGIWDADVARGQAFAAQFETTAFLTADALFEASEAIMITCENKLHADYVEMAAGAGKHILCEKPLATTEAEWDRMRTAVERAGVKLMTAFPCRYSPAFRRLKERVDAGEIGAIQAICATNRGRNPGGWFIQTELSGGGAMIDHVVHVTDLLRVLLKADPISVQAFTGNNMYGQDWEDTAMLTLEFPGGLFVTLDSSWSRPLSYKTWGDVTMNVVGEKGVIELNMFGQGFDQYVNDPRGIHLVGFGSDLDAGLVDDFLKCVRDDTQPPVTGHDGWKASQVALAGYESARTGKVVLV